MEREFKALRVEKFLLHKVTAEVIRIAAAERRRGLNFTDRLILSVKIEFVGLVMKFTRASCLGVGWMCPIWNRPRVKRSGNGLDGLNM